MSFTYWLNDLSPLSVLGLHSPDPCRWILDNIPLASKWNRENERERERKKDKGEKKNFYSCQSKYTQWPYTWRLLSSKILNPTENWCLGFFMSLASCVLFILNVLTKRVTSRRTCSCTRSTGSKRNNFFTFLQSKNNKNKKRQKTHDRQCPFSFLSIIQLY